MSINIKILLFLVLLIVITVNFLFHELHEEIVSAIEREKQIKSGPRKRKIKLIEKMNPNWRDLYKTLY